MNITYIIVFLVGFLVEFLIQYSIIGNPKTVFNDKIALQKAISECEIALLRATSTIEQQTWTISNLKEELSVSKKTIEVLEDTCERLANKLDSISKQK